MQRTFLIFVFSVFLLACNKNRPKEYCAEDAMAQQEMTVQDADEKMMHNTIQNIGIIIIVLLLTTLAIIIHISLERKRINRALKQIDKERQEFYNNITRHFHTPLTAVLDMCSQLSRFIPENDQIAKQEYETLTNKSQELLELLSAMVEYNDAAKKENHTVDISDDASIKADAENEATKTDEENPGANLKLTLNATTGSHAESETDRRNHTFLQKVNRIIHKNITNREVNAAMLAEHMNTSIGTLNRKMNSITGMSTTNYIRLRKLQYAKYLLKHSEMSMSEIQATCGFESPSYFSRAFKAEFNITPTEYRNS